MNYTFGPKVFQTNFIFLFSDGSKCLMVGNDYRNQNGVNQRLKMYQKSA